MIELVLPDITSGMIEYLKGKTVAGESVMEDQGRATRAPYIIVIWDGDIQEQHNTAVPTGRVTTEFWGRTVHQARYGSRQIREALLTPGDSTGGVHAVVSYHDEGDDADKLITLTGARLESGPREAPDRRDRMITTYLVGYY